MIDFSSCGSVERVAAHRDAFARWEPTLQAFVTLDPAAFDPTRAIAGPLAGVHVGIKDIIDVAGLPTRNGSLTCEFAPPAAADAHVVAALRNAGATIVGKTTTTEFAFTDPTLTTNPFDPARTPGGSSAGSGAAVGARVLDLALGTQTAGSLIRPAAYCGVAGFKPSFGRVSTVGVTALAPSFDTVGFIGQDLEVIMRAWSAIASAFPDRSAGAPVTLSIEHPRVGIAPADPDAQVAEEVARAVLSAARVLTGGDANGMVAATGVDIRQVIVDHRTVMADEMHAIHGHWLDTDAERLKPNVRAALRAARGTEPEAVVHARERLARARERFWSDMQGFDVLVAAPAPTVAPLRDGTTGYQHMLTPWTVFRGPLVCVPWGHGASGMPLSVMLASRPGTDDRLLAIASSLARRAPPLVRPAPPTR